MREIAVQEHFLCARTVKLTNAICTLISRHHRLNRLRFQRKFKIAQKPAELCSESRSGCRKYVPTGNKNLVRAACNSRNEWKILRLKNTRKKTLISRSGRSSFAFICPRHPVIAIAERDKCMIKFHRVRKIQMYEKKKKRKKSHHGSL